jgi:hypothetical protein
MKKYTNKVEKMKKASKKYHLLKANKQIRKPEKRLKKKKKMIFTINGIILKMNITHYQKVKWIIKNMKMK